MCDVVMMMAIEKIIRVAVAGVNQRDDRQDGRVGDRECTRDS